jgi:hypothetical protein
MRGYYGGRGLAAALAVMCSGAAWLAPSVSAQVDCVNAGLRTGPSAALPDCRAFELVSPAYKPAGIGIGYTYVGFGELITSGFGAAVGDRYAALGNYGSTLIDDGAAFTSNWAFAQRDGSQGWQSHSPQTKALTNRQVTRMPFVIGATDDLSRTLWRANGPFPVFDEMATLNLGNAALIGDWDGRWEVYGPTDPAQVEGGSSDSLEFAFADDGSRLAAAGDLWGLSGVLAPDHPTRSERLAGRSVYLADVSAPPANTFAGTGARRLINVCTGTGATRTKLPSRGADGKLATQVCPEPSGGASARLVSRYGATFTPGANISKSDDPLNNVVSRNGSRVFFMAPDPAVVASPTGSQSVANPGSLTCAETTGEETSCPPQLYVWQEGQGGGEPVVRWISKAESGLLGLQDSSLTGQTFFEGATPDGDKVFFRTTSPLTTDDPNGVRDGGGATVPPPEGGVVAGSDSLTSWDLYMYDFPDDPGADPGEGDLVRISGGPTGGGDCNNPQGTPGVFTPVTTQRAATLRFASDDGARVYFTCSGPLPGVPPAENGTVTSPAGDPTTGFPTRTNLYLFDRNASVAHRWRFIANLPRATTTSPAARRLQICATTGGYSGNPLTASGNVTSVDIGGVNCVHGLEDGSFVTFFTDGGLVAGDDEVSGDLYGYDAEVDQLVRISTPNTDAVGLPYTCVSSGDDGQPTGAQCYGDAGFDHAAQRRPAPLPGVVADPDGLGERVVFFQSRSRLAVDDRNETYDVYAWRDGELRLVTSGAEDADHVLYRGQDRTGRNLYLATRAKLSWQDVDAVGDIYVARVEGGFAPPPEPELCGVLAGLCEGVGGGRLDIASPLSSAPGGGDATSVIRGRLSIESLSPVQRRRAARRGVIALRVRANVAGSLRGVAKTRLRGRSRTVSRAAYRLAKPGTVTLRLKLNREARRNLRRGRALRVSVVVSRVGGGPADGMVVRLRRAAR